MYPLEFAQAEIEYRQARLRAEAENARLSRLAGWWAGWAAGRSKVARQKRSSWPTAQAPGGTTAREAHAVRA